MDDLSTLLHLVSVLYAQVPWLFWGAAIVIGTFLWLYLLALVNTAWRLCTSADARAWFRLLRQARREHRRQEWATRRETDPPLWRRGDGPVIVGLVLLAAIVIAVCR